MKYGTKVCMKCGKPASAGLAGEWGIIGWLSYNHGGEHLKCPPVERPELTPLPDTPRWRSLWRHKKSGHMYIVVDVARLEATLEPVVIYHRRGAGSEMWVRPHAEFMDGRFELVLEGMDI